MTRHHKASKLQSSNRPVVLGQGVYNIGFSPHPLPGLTRRPRGQGRAERIITRRRRRRCYEARTYVDDAHAYSLSMHKTVLHMSANRRGGRIIIRFAHDRIDGRAICAMKGEVEEERASSLLSLLGDGHVKIVNLTLL